MQPNSVHLTPSQFVLFSFSFALLTAAPSVVLAVVLLFLVGGGSCVYACVCVYACACMCVKCTSIEELSSRAEGSLWVVCELMIKIASWVNTHVLCLVECIIYIIIVSHLSLPSFRRHDGLYTHWLAS